MDNDLTGDRIVGVIQGANGVLDAALSNPEPFAALGTMAALWIGASKRGGGKFVVLVESLPVIVEALNAAGTLVTSLGAIVQKLYTTIKASQASSTQE